MEGAHHDDKVVEIYHLVPLNSTVTSGIPCDINASVLSNTVDHATDQTYLVLPMTEPLIQPVLSVSDFPTGYAQDSQAITSENAEETPYHSCNDCEVKFVDIDELILHQRRSHSNHETSSERLPMVHCVICSKQFDTEIQLEFHMTADHKGCRPYRCEFCARRYANLTSLDVHILEEHTNRLKPYECTSCLASFPMKKELIEHIRSEHGQKYICQFCVKYFRSVNQLRRHVRTHTGPFNSASTRNALNELVTEEARNEEKCAPDEDRSDEVVRIDADANVLVPSIFRCPLCDETFLEKRNQEAHILIHVDECPFECPDCGSLFQDIEMFQSHIDAHDENRNRTHLEQNIDEAIDIINYDDIHHNIDSLLSNTEFQDFDEEHDHNLTEIMMNLKKVGSKGLEDIGNDSMLKSMNALHEENVAISLQTAQSVLNVVDGFNQELTNDPLEECSRQGEVFKISLSQPNKRPPVSVEWQKRDKKIRNFKCVECNRSFTLARTLALHMRRTHLGIKPYECAECGWKFAQSSDLIKHKRTHTGEKPFVCDYCNSSFTQKRNLVSHMKLHLGKPSNCKYCSQAFLIEENLKQHMKKHEGPSMENCRICDIPYASKKEMDIHTRKQHREPLLNACNDCGKSFERSYDLKIHRAIHTGERRFQCDQCEKSFTHATSLRNHRTGVHSNERRFQCAECGKHFAFLGNLKVHMRVHSSERHFLCNICQKSFTRQSSLMEHRKIHLGIKSYKCETCDKAFINSSAYFKHKQIHRKRAHHCHVCNRDFVQNSHLVKHLHTHTKEKWLQCEFCEKIFQRADTLANHRKTHEKQDKQICETKLMHNQNDARSKIPQATPECKIQCESFNTTTSIEATTNHQFVYTFTANDLAILSQDVVQPIVHIQPLMHLIRSPEK